MNIKEVRRVVAGIKSTLFKNSNSYSVGMLKSQFRGTGLQFKEHQIYTHGDDVRFIDWKILAKTQVPYIKTFEEERNLEIVVLIDAGPSMMYGANGVSKLQASIELCCLLYLLAAETNDKVHCIVVGKKIINLPKLSGEEGIIRLIDKLEAEHILKPDGKVNISYEEDEASSNQHKMEILKYLKGKKEIVLLSDFNDFVPLIELKKLILRSHIHCFQILAPLDEAIDLPFHFLSKSFGEGPSKKFVKANLKGQNEIDSVLGRKLKKLKVEERYLETFIREMI